MMRALGGGAVTALTAGAPAGSSCRAPWTAAVAATPHPGGDGRARPRWPPS